MVKHWIHFAQFMSWPIVLFPPGVTELQAGQVKRAEEKLLLFAAFARRFVSAETTQTYLSNLRTVQAKWCGAGRLKALGAVFFRLPLYMSSIKGKVKRKKRAKVAWDFEWFRKMWNVWACVIVVVRYCDGTFVIAIYGGGGCLGVTQVMHERAHPYAIRACIAQCHILSLCR